MAAIRGGLLVSPGEFPARPAGAGACAGATTTPGRSPFRSVLVARALSGAGAGAGEGGGGGQVRATGM